MEFCARDAAAVQATSAELGATGTALDVGGEPALTGWVAEAAARLGGIDVVVANVSALAIPDVEENWQASFQVDLMGTVRLATAALPHLRESSSAAIVAISSVSGREVDFAAGPCSTG